MGDVDPFWPRNVGLSTAAATAATTTATAAANPSHANTRQEAHRRKGSSRRAHSPEAPPHDAAAGTPASPADPPDAAALAEQSVAAVLQALAAGAGREARQRVPRVLELIAARRKPRRWGGVGMQIGLQMGQTVADSIPPCTTRGANQWCF